MGEGWWSIYQSRVRYLHERCITSRCKYPYISSTSGSAVHLFTTSWADSPSSNHSNMFENMEQKSREPILRNRVCTDPVPLNISHHEDITWYTKIRKYYLVDADVESWGDDTTLVQTTVQFNDNLASSVVIDDFEFTNVSVFHHNLKKLDDDLKGILGRHE